MIFCQKLGQALFTKFCVILQALVSIFAVLRTCSLYACYIFAILFPEFLEVKLLISPSRRISIMTQFFNLMRLLDYNTVIRLVRGFTGSRLKTLVAIIN